MNSLASEGAYTWENKLKKKKHLWDWVAGMCTSVTSGTVNYNQNQGTICPHFAKITKKVCHNWFCLLQEEKKKSNSILRHSLWGFGRKTAYWVDPDLDTLILDSWPHQSQTRALWLWIKLFDSSAPRDTQSLYSQLLHKRLWNPWMVFVNSAAMRMEPTCQMLTWLWSVNKFRRETSYFFCPKKRACGCQGIISRGDFFLSLHLPPKKKKKWEEELEEMTNLHHFSSYVTHDMRTWSKLTACLIKFRVSFVISTMHSECTFYLLSSDFLFFLLWEIVLQPLEGH